MQCLCDTLFNADVRADVPNSPVELGALTTGRWPKASSARRKVVDAKTLEADHRERLGDVHQECPTPGLYHLLAPLSLLSNPSNSELVPKGDACRIILDAMFPI